MQVLYLAWLYQELQNFASRHCKKLNKPPYVCNGCEKQHSCKLIHAYYSANRAHDAYKRELKESRSGIRTNIVPLWEKYTLTIREAAEYFNIGEKRLRSIVYSNPNADFVVMNGNRVMIKRKIFELYIDKATAVWPINRRQSPTQYGIFYVCCIGLFLRKELEIW